MNAGFNTVSIAHRIDEFVFDCSFDSLAQANAFEPEMSALLTEKLLPVIDSVLDEFDQTGAVWRLDHVEIDLGDIASSDFYTELVRRVQEKLRERLRRLQEHHQPPGSVTDGMPPARRLNKMQTDLEILQDFLLTGRMPWHIDAADRYAHENVLRQIVQQHDARKAWITLLKHLTAAQRTVAIGRLVAQFSHRSLENVLTGIAPADARPLLDFLSIYQHALSEVDSSPAVQSERIRPVWEQLFRMLLESNPLPGNWTILLDRLIKTIVPQHAQASSPVLHRIRQAATQFHQEGKISGAFHAALQTVSSLYLQHPRHGPAEQPALLKHRNGNHAAARSGAKATSSDEEIQRETSPEQYAGEVHEELFARIAEALRKAGLIDADFVARLMELAPLERRQRLRRVLQLPAVKPRLPQLPQAALLDIGYWLSPPAALLMERLLAHAGRLYRLPGTAGHITRKHWKQQRWSAALDYLLRATDSSGAIDPIDFMRALAHGAHGEAADLQITLRAWREALAHSEPYSVIAMLLRMLTGETPEQSTQAEGSAAQSGKSPQQNTQQPLHERLTTGKAVPAQQDPATLLKALASGQPEQLRQLYQDLRNGRYDWTVAQLDATGLHNLIERLLHTQSGATGADWPVFLQALAAQADRVDDQASYYRRVLQDLLQEREIDLEAIAAPARQPRNRAEESEGHRSEQAAAEEIKRAEEAERTEIAGQAPLEVAEPVVYPAEQSAKPVHTGHAALYLRITAALHDEGLIDRHPEVIVQEINPDELRQRLRAILRGIDMNGWIEKLPQSVWMDIACLLSPQAALLNEHVLAQADTLHRSIATGTASSRKQWQQRLWQTSLNFLLTETGSDITPAAYLQALARGVSDGSDPRAVLRAWYEALQQNKAFGVVHTVLQTFFSGAPEKNQASTALHLLPRVEAATKTGELEDAGLPETSPETAASLEPEQYAGGVHEELYARIAEALQKAGLIDADFAARLMELAPLERRQRLRLRRVLQLPAVKPRLPQLPQAVLLDIGYWLSPPAALLMERLLAHAGRLYRLPGTAGHITRKHWKQQRWSAALDYLLRATDSSGAIDPIDFMRALAHGAHGEAADLQITLRAWREALAHSEPYSVIAMLLRMLTGETPEQSTQAEESAAQSGKSPQQNTQQPLHERLTTGKAVPAQQDPATLLKALASGQPEQLRQLYQDLRNGRYDWTVAQLDATGLHNLIERLLHTQSGATGADWPVFLQALAAQADRVDDQASYYRRVLQDLLQEREIDLEAIAAPARQPRNRAEESEGHRSEQAAAEEIKRAEEAERTEIAGQAPLEVAEPVVYPAEQSAKPVHTGHAALYLRITAALHDEGLIDRHPEVIVQEINPDELRQRLRAILRGIDMNGWIEKLPQSVWMDIACLLSPQAALLNEHVLAQADTLHRSIATGTASSRKQWQQRLWQTSLNFLLTETGSDITPAAYLQALARGVSDGSDPRAVLRAWYEALQQNKASAAIHTLGQTIAEALAAPLRRDEENKGNPGSDRLMAGAEENAAAMQKPPLLDWDALLHRAQSTDDVREEIYIENAGQVLAAPYLPRLFDMLKLVEDGAFVDRHAAERAVHLLQFMVNAQTRSPEYQLTLNKILCGVTTGIPICAEIGISAHEQETIEGLIRGMIQNWRTIGNTSISGLRETFLQRKGKLQLKEDGMWYLTVEPGVFDMLLDSLPWSYSVIKHSWMERAVHVTWR